MESSAMRWVTRTGWWGLGTGRAAEYQDVMLLWMRYLERRQEFISQLKVSPLTSRAEIGETFSLHFTGSEEKCRVL
jgi:hypothetical protein